MTEQLNVVGFADRLSGQRIAKMDEWGVPKGLVIAKIQDVLTPRLLKKINTPAVFLVQEDSKLREKEEATLRVLFFCLRGEPQTLTGLYGKVWVMDLQKDQINLANDADDARIDKQPTDALEFAHALITGEWPRWSKNKDGVSDPIDEIPDF